MYGVRKCYSFILLQVVDQFSQHECGVFKSAFFLTFIKRLFSSSLLSALRVMSSTYLRLLILFPGNLDSSLCFIQPGLCMMYSAYKLNKQGDNIEP